MEIRDNKTKTIPAVAHPSCGLGTRVTEILFLDPSKTTVQLLNSPPTRWGSWYCSGAFSQCCENSVWLLVKENFETPPRVFPSQEETQHRHKSSTALGPHYFWAWDKMLSHFQATANKPLPSSFHLLNIQLSPFLLLHCLRVDKLWHQHQVRNGTDLSWI